MPINFDDLTAPFPPEEIDWRVGSTTKDKSKGMALAYIDARCVMDRLDEVIGPDNWQCRYMAVGEKTCCEIGIRLLQTAEGGEESFFDWVWKADGAGDTDFEGAKGAFSDAFKRAAVKWGVGRYLYDLSSPWVAIEPRGKSFIICNHEIPRLQACLPNTPDVAPEPAKPEGRQVKTELQNNLKAFAEQLGELQTEDELEDLLTTFHQTIEEAKVSLPSWWSDGIPSHPEFVPLERRIEAKRNFIQQTTILAAG